MWKGWECLICSLIPTVNHISVVAETTDRHLQGQERNPTRSGRPPHSRGKDVERGSHTQGGSVGSFEPRRFCPPAQKASASVAVRSPSWPLCSGSFWNHERLPAPKGPAPEEPQALFLGRPNPPRVSPLQTEVTVLTLADRACLNLLFRSCMLGDLGLGMREVLRFSGVPLGCCL